MSIDETLLKIDNLREELDGLRPIDPERMARVMQKFRLDWNYHSNHIEGNSLTYGETKSLLLHGITADGKPLKDHLDIKGHNEAILLLDEILKSERPVTEAFIRELHQIILVEPYERPAQTPDGRPTTRRIRVGEYKREPNHVRTVTGEIFYFATPEETPARMEELMNWYRETESEGKIHPLAVAALFHYRFIRIHPFDDGNGRISRIMMNLILMKHGYPPAIVRADKKEDYYRALRQADGGDVEKFIDLIGQRLIASLETMIKGARGEDIEEPDDLDKKIELLKGIISGKNKTIIQSTETEIAFFRTDYSHLIAELLILQAKFKDFFHWTHITNSIINREFEYLAGDEGGWLVETSEIFTQNPERFVSDDDYLAFITVNLYFNKFNRGGIEGDFSSNYEIVIIFEEYGVAFKWADQVQKVRYSDNKTTIVTSIIRFIKEDLLSKIQGHVTD